MFDKKQTKALQRELRTMLNGWDFLKVVQEGVKDEYDYLADRLISQLIRESSADAITDVLKNELGDHFGLNPKDYEIAPFAGKVTNWFNQNYKRQEEK